MEAASEQGWVELSIFKKPEILKSNLDVFYWAQAHISYQPNMICNEIRYKLIIVSPNLCLPVFL